MINKICRICLCTNKKLQELNKYLSDYLLDICVVSDKASRSPAQLCCSSCTELLKNSLDFRNKCQKSHQILLEWENDISQKYSIHSLHNLLTDTKSVEHLEVKFEEALIQSNYIASDDINNIKVEINGNNIDDIENYNEKELVKVENVKVKRTKKEKPGEHVEKKCKLRGEIAKRSEFTQYESIFDIKLFATYAEARQELLGRRHSEPYLSAAYRCELCYTVYKCHKLLQFHMKWHDPSPELCHVCDVCSMRFLSRGTLLKHKPNCHRGRFACKLCPLVTYQRQAMKAHYQKHQGKIYKCHCDRVFNHISSYMTHRRTVHVSEHVCSVCARTFVSKLGLRDHMIKMHQTELKSEGEAVSCVPCGLKFMTQQVYTVHVLNTQAHREQAKDIVACSVCGVAFANAAQVKEHKRLNHARAQNNTKTHLKRDELSDAKEKVDDLVECKLCGLSGASPAWLYQHHRRLHPATPYAAPRGPRPYLCEICGQAFYKKLQLEEHMLVHSGLKPFRCDTCHKTFRTKMSLKNHSERHAPATRACPHCPKKFNSAANLSNHVRSHTGLRRFVCLCCGKGFLHRAALREHTRAVHLHIKRTRIPNKIL